MAVAAPVLAATSRSSPDRSGSPVQTGDIIDEAGWRPLVELAALLSLSLAVFNTLPIPGLDGGRMFFVLLEYARGGRRVSPEKEALVHFVGIALLLSLFVVITVQDVQRLFS